MDEQDALRRLREAHWLNSRPVQTLFALLDGDRGATRAVGGAVRDSLLDCLKMPVEVDFATALTPEAVKQKARAAKVRCIPTGIDFGTVTLLIEGQSFEVTTLREDVETDGRHAVVSFGTDWAADAARRDFSLNALYCGPDGSLFDPLGGLDDCLSRRVRFIGDAAERIEEDRLRVYRFFRFSASHGGQRFDAAGLAASRDAAGKLDRLSAERVGQEMLRLLALPEVATTLKAMAGADIIALPEAVLAAMVHYESYDVGAEMPVRLALIGWETDWTRLQDRWRLPNRLVSAARMRVQAAQLLAEGKMFEALADFGAVAEEAVWVAGARYGWPQAQCAMLLADLAGAPPADFPVQAGDLIERGVTPGPELGRRLAALRQKWVESGFALDRETLLKDTGPAD